MVAWQCAGRVALLAFFFAQIVVLFGGWYESTVRWSSRRVRIPGP